MRQSLSPSSGSRSAEKRRMFDGTVRSSSVDQQPSPPPQGSKADLQWREHRRRTCPSTATCSPGRACFTCAAWCRRLTRFPGGFQPENTVKTCFYQRAAAVVEIRQTGA